MLMDIPAGVLADRFGRKQSMVPGLVLIALSSVVAGMANSYTWLIVERTVQGIGSALILGYCSDEEEAIYYPSSRSL